MPYFVDHTTNRVVVLPPGADPPPSATEVDVHTAAACDLTHDQALSEAQMGALIAGSVDGYLAATPAGRVATARPPTPAQPRDPRSPATQRASGVARAVEGLSWLLLVVSVIGGLVVAFSTTTDPTTGQSTHDSVGAGLLLVFAGVFQCLVVIMVAVYIQARTEVPPRP